MKPDKALNLKTVFEIGEREAFSGSAGILPAKIVRTIQCIRFAGKMPALPKALPRLAHKPKTVFGFRLFDIFGGL